MLLQNNPNKDYDGFPTKPSSNFANMLSLISVALRHVEADKGCVRVSRIVGYEVEFVCERCSVVILNNLS